MKKATFKWFYLPAALLLLSLAAYCQPAIEGFDPLMRQIAAQAPHPNIGITLDASLYMANDATSQIPVGVDSTGFPYWKYDGCYTSANWDALARPIYGVGWPGGTGNKYVHIYWLVGGRPSRMAIVKNALGNSVTIYKWTPPAVYPEFSTWTHPTETIDGIPWYWKGAKNTSRPAAPSTLTIPTGCPTTAPACPVGGILSWQCPKDLIGQTKNMINWGLVVYSTTEGNCDKARVVTTFDLADSGNVTALETAMGLKRDGGIDCSGYPNARGAMKFMADYLGVQAAGGDLTDIAHTIQNLPQDTKFFSCKRVYGAILITGTGSSACNEGDFPNIQRDWINPCGTGMYTCNAAEGTWDCDRGARIPDQPAPNRPRNFSAYPGGRIDELWNKEVSDGTSNRRLNARTWVIGVESLLNRCEINFCAYMGRTDAGAPEGDAGFNSELDFDRLPAMNPDGTLASTDGEELDSHYNINDPRITGRNYAYFAPGAETFQQAFTDIYAGLTTGDYAASAIVGTPASAGGGYLAYIATAELPKWKGHLYAFDTHAEPSVLVYDAANVLNSESSAARKIYTWDGAGALCEVIPANLTHLQGAAVAANPSFDPNTLTAEVVDFIRGNNGSGAARSWKLGPILNSAPAIIGTPGHYNQGIVDPGHETFVTDHAARKPLLYVGAGDGMLHCFMTTDETDVNSAFAPGHELFAVVPPNLLSKQVKLYDNFINRNMVTGQNKEPKEHIFGVANSFRYGDVYFPTGWKTVLFVTEGPGGDAVAALDVTDPFGKLTKTTPEFPVSVLWNFPSPSLPCPKMRNSWSIPAFGPVSASGFKGVIGTGYDSINDVTTPRLLVFDPVDGSTEEKFMDNAASSYVRNQAFANSVIYSADTNGSYNDSLVNLGLQADLHGRIWFYNPSDGALTKGIDVSPAPLYYPPAVSGYKKGEDTYDIYAFASGTYYEKDPDITGGAFAPRLYVATKTPWGPDNAGMTILSTPINGIAYSYNDGNGNPQTGTIGARARVIAPPVLLSPVDESADPQVIFEIYDPGTSDCGGTTFIVTVKITFDGVHGVGLAAAGYGAGTGAASGFTIIGGKIVVAHSGVGKGKLPTIHKASDVNLSISSGVPVPNCWRELQ